MSNIDLILDRHWSVLRRVVSYQSLVGCLSSFNVARAANCQCVNDCKVAISFAARRGDSLSSEAWGQTPLGLPGFPAAWVAEGVKDTGEQQTGCFVYCLGT
jgi:hypothetical protein